jgi:hypothetical protein
VRRAAIGDKVMVMTPSITLAADLARDRLLQRLGRLDRVIAALHARARAYEAAGVPRPLTISLSEFEAERAAVESALDAHLAASTPGGTL